MQVPGSNPPRRLIASSKVSGTAVYNLKGERLGHIDDVMIDKREGRVAYAMLAFGGFLGFNDHHYPLPWSALRYDPVQDGYVVDIDPETLDRAPSVKPGDEVEFADLSWRRVDDYYGIRADDEVPLGPTGR